MERERKKRKSKTLHIYINSKLAIYYRVPPQAIDNAAIHRQERGDNPVQHTKSIKFRLILPKARYYPYTEIRMYLVHDD